MNQNLKCIVAILLLFLQFNVEAQKNDIDDMLTVQLKKTGVVEQQNMIKGYYSFYRVEKADKIIRYIWLKYLMKMPER